MQLVDKIPLQYRIPAMILFLAVVLGLGAALGAYVRGAFADRAILALKVDHAEDLAEAERARTKAVSAALDKERQLKSDIEGKANEQRQKDVDHAQRVAAIVTELDQLRAVAARYSASRACTSRAPLPAVGAASAPAANVVQDPSPGSDDLRDQLLEESRVAIRELAPALQRSHERHTALAEWYNVTRERLRKWGSEGRDVKVSPQ